MLIHTHIHTLIHTQGQLNVAIPPAFILLGGRRKEGGTPSRMQTSESSAPDIHIYLSSDLSPKWVWPKFFLFFFLKNFKFILNPTTVETLHCRENAR